ncbi:MAG: ABC transporter permease [Gemmatimonadales bacterium]
MAERRGPPRWAARFLLWRLPDEIAEAVCGDLEQEHAERVARGGNRLAADLWFCAQALTLRVGALRRAARRVHAVRPGRIGRVGRTGRIGNGEGGGVSWLDVRLGLRMARKHPVMTAASVFALAVGIPASTIPGHVADVTERSLPEDPEHRIRALRYWNEATLQPVSPTHFELERWGAELSSFESIGAFRTAEYNLAIGEAGAAPARGAEVTGSVFAILGAVPLHGRTLNAEDERPGSAAVVVIGHDLWQARLSGDPEVVGSTIRVGGVARTVVGVMPEGFFFPSRQQLWVPLPEELVVEPAAGRPLEVFGRLAEGATDDEASAEVIASGRRLADAFPATNARLAAEVVPFGVSELRLPAGGWRGLNDSRLLTVLAFILLGVACTNVAMLVFARTATRFRELAIRTSLGASRRRLVFQMFTESLVLSLSAAGLGLLAWHLLLVRVESMLLAAESITFPPYWMRFGLTWDAVTGALLVALLSATLAGVLPALKVTGSRIQENIRKAQAGRSGIRFGGVTATLIVADVAIAVAVMGLAVGMAGQLRESFDTGDRVGIVAEEYLALEVTLPIEAGASADGRSPAEELEDRVARTQRALVERLQADPRVRSVAVADALPRQDHRHRRTAIEGETSWLTVEGRPGAAAPPALPVARVDVGFFEALGQPILAGRGFGQADLAEGVSTAIVNTHFVERRMGGRNPIGQRIRFWSGTFEGGDFEPRWYEIVGVVGPLGMNVALPEQDAGVYLPAAPGQIHPLRLAVHLAVEPESFVPVARSVVADVAPNAVLAPPRPLDRVVQGTWYGYVGAVIALAIILTILVALAASGIYAIMSFAVSERTREIGIRRALGERKATVALRVGRRSVVQIAIGALLGTPLAVSLYRLTELGYSRNAATFGLGVALAGAVGVALAVGALACWSPMRRALRIPATEALRGEA